MNPQGCVVAIDPGSAKCGIAIVNCNGDSPFRSVVEASILTAELNRLIMVYRPREIVVGDGTGSKPALEAIRRDLQDPLPIRTVPEDFSSEEARKRYVMEVRPRGFHRLIPHALRTPPGPYDDYVAVILGERYWRMIHDKPEVPNARG